MPLDTLKQIEHWIMAILRHAVAALLFALMLLTCIDVLGRYFFNRPVYGGLELTEVILAGVIFTALPIITYRGEQVMIDLFSLPGRRLRMVQHVVTNLIGAGAVAVVSWQLWLRGARLGRAGETTIQIEIPMSLVAYAISCLLALTALAFLIRSVIPDGYVTSGAGAQGD